MLFCGHYPYAIGILAFALGWTLLCLPWLSGAVTIPYDAKAHFQAHIQFLANAIQSGQSPFWNPDAFAGQPQIADPQSLIFSPAIILAFLTSSPSFRVVDAYVFALLGMGGIAVILLFREMKWPVAGALVAAFAFSFGASAALRIQHIGQIESLSFFMVAQWLMVRLLLRANWPNAVSLGIAIALMIVEPDQVALLGVYALALQVFLHLGCSQNWRLEIKRLATPMIIGGLVCVICTAIPIILIYLFVETTTRAVIPFAEAARGSLHPASLLTSVFADLYGAIDRKIEYWGPFSDAWGGPSYALTQNMGQIYIGALPALAILVTGILGRRAWAPEARFYTLAAVCMLLFALGRHTPFFWLAYHGLPGISGFRRPADATFLLGAYGAILGGFLINEWLKQADQQKSVTKRMSLLAVGIGASLFLVAMIVAWTTDRLPDASLKLMQSALWLAAAYAIMSVIRFRNMATACLALSALMIADLWANNGPNESTALPPAQFEVLQRNSSNSTICEIKKTLSLIEAPDRRDRVELVGLGFHWPNAGLVHSLESILGYNPLRLDVYSTATGANDQVAGWDQRKFSALFPSYKSTLANMLGLRLIVSGVPIEQIDKKLRPGDMHLVARTRDAWIYENPRALPRVLFATDWRLADFDDLIAKGKWPEFNPRHTVLLDSDPNPIQIQLTAPGANKVRILKYENTRVEIEVEAAQPGFVVLNDIWHPWWRATLNGEQTEILPANVLFRAVQVKAGLHKVVFEFNPVSGAIAELKEKLFDSGD